MHKIEQSGELLGRFLGLLLNTDFFLPLIESVLKPLAKNASIPLGLIAAAATDADIHKKMLESGVATLIISNEQINDIIKIVKSLEASGLLTKGVGETIKNEVKKQKGGFLSVLLDKLGASLLGYLLACKGIIKQAGQDF